MTSVSTLKHFGGENESRGERERRERVEKEGKKERRKERERKATDNSPSTSKQDNHVKRALTKLYGLARTNLRDFLQ